MSAQNNQCASATKVGVHEEYMYHTSSPRQRLRRCHGTSCEDISDIHHVWTHAPRWTPQVRYILIHPPTY